jgi:DNA polymerase-3 subunit delta
VPSPIHLVRGADPVLVADAVRALVTELVGDGDRALTVDELSGTEFALGAAIDAANTPPFLTDRRVVVVRNAARFSKTEDVAPLVAYLEAPLDTSALVVVWEKAPDQAQLATVPKKLADAVKAAGGVVVATDPPSGRARDEWVNEQLAKGPVQLDGRARSMVSERLGDDVSDLGGLLNRLAGAYGQGANLGADDVEPFLGQAGSVPPWELTDAIDRGDTAGALDRLHRMLGAGERHSLQLMATLQGHYGRMLRLDGAPVRSEREAADLLGMKGSTFPAKKALTQTRKLGHDGVVRAVTLLAEADLDLRGAKAWPPELVLEVLVARLSRLAGTARR